MAQVAVPLATYTGWNLFNPASGPSSLLSSMQGAYIPLPRMRADREQTRDPRPSVDERYRSREHYITLVTAAAHELVRQGYLLEEDVAALATQAERHWSASQESGATVESTK